MEFRKHIDCLMYANSALRDSFDDELSPIVVILQLKHLPQLRLPLLVELALEVAEGLEQQQPPRDIHAV